MTSLLMFVTSTGAELRSKIDSERDEVERLEEEIHEIRTMREGLYSSCDERSDESDSDEDDEPVEGDASDGAGSTGDDHGVAFLHLANVEQSEVGRHARPAEHA